MGNKVAASCGATANDLASQISRTPATYKPIVSLSVISDRKFEFKVEYVADLAITSNTAVAYPALLL